MSVEGETVSLANGCVCCTIRDDLVGACLGLLERPELPEHLIIEMSGVADPVPVLNTFMETDLGTVFRLSSILAVADAEQLPGLTGEMANLARMQIQTADIVVLNKVDLISRDKLDVVRQQVHDMTPGSRIIEVTQGRIPLALVFGDGDHVPETRSREASDDHGEHSHDQVFTTWNWTNNHPLSLPRLRSALETLPDTVYRCKGIVYLEEIPAYRYVLQMVGKRYHLIESDRWGAEFPQSEIVLIGGQNGIDAEDLQHTFDACVGTGDDANSPILRLMRKIAPELSSPIHPIE